MPPERRLRPGEPGGLEPKVGSLALDGEREIEVMSEAARRSLLDGAPTAAST